MFFLGSNEIDLVLVIEILEVLLFVQSIALAVQSERKVVKIINILAAVFMLFCIIYNALTFKLI